MSNHTGTGFNSGRGDHRRGHGRDSDLFGLPGVPGRPEQPESHLRPPWLHDRCEPIRAGSHRPAGSGHRYADAPRTPATSRAGGFTLIEVIMAMLILSVATMAMGASTGHIMGQIHAATLRTERMTAVRETAESLRHADWASLETACADAGSSFGTEHFAVSCSVNLVAGNLKEVLLITTGPGVRAGRIVPSLPDTFGISIANPAD